MALAATPTSESGQTLSTLQEVVQFSCHTLDKATKTKLTLEQYYSNLITQNKERRERWQRLEETLKDDSIPEDQKAEKRQQHASKETEFLRLKRSKLGVEDFDPLKVSENFIILKFIQNSFRKKVIADQSKQQKMIRLSNLTFWFHNCF